MGNTVQHYAVGKSDTPPPDKLTPESLHASIKEQESKEEAVEAPPRQEAEPEVSLPGLDNSDDILKYMTVQPPPQDFIITDLILRGTTAVLNSPGGVGKSYLLLLLCMALATSVDIPPFKFPKQRRILYLNVEDPKDENWRRIHNIAKCYDGLAKNVKQIVKNLKFCSFRGKLGPLMQLENGNPVSTPVSGWLSEMIEQSSAELVVIDTKSRLFGLDENSNDHAAQWWNEIENIQAKCDSPPAVLVVAHSSKAGSGSADQRSNRGASSFVDNARLNIVLNKMSKKDAKRLGVDRREIFTMDVPKQNYSEGNQTYYFKRLEYGVPKYVNLEAERFSKALDILIELMLEDHAGKMCKRDLLVRGPGKEIRKELKDEFSISQDDFKALVSYGIDSTRLEEITGQGDKKNRTDISVRLVSK